MNDAPNAKGAAQATPKDPRLRAVVHFEGEDFINISADEMDRDGEHLVFLRGGSLVAVARMSEVRSAHLTEKKPEK